MIASVMILQVSAFIDKRVEPSLNLMTELAKRIKEVSNIEFLPSVRANMVYNVDTGVSSSVNNLYFSSSDGMIQIVFIDNRLDIVVNYKEEDAFSKGIDFANEVEIFVAILQTLMKLCELKANRLALNTDILSNVITNVAKTSFGKNLVSQMDFYKGKELFDWVSRANANADVQIDEKNEKLNVITEISEAFNNQNSEKRVHCHLDINTVPLNTEFRFDAKSYTCFWKAILPITDNIINDFNKLSEEG